MGFVRWEDLYHREVGGGAYLGETVGIRIYEKTFLLRNKPPNTFQTACARFEWIFLITVLRGGDFCTLNY